METCCNSLVTGWNRTRNRPVNLDPLLTLLPRQSHRKTVCYHKSSGSILQRYFSSFNLFPNEMMLNINMLGASMVLEIVSKCEASLVICKDGDRWEHLVLAIQNLTEEEANPNCFLSSLPECHILSFGGGQGHSGLFLA